MAAGWSADTTLSRNRLRRSQSKQLSVTPNVLEVDFRETFAYDGLPLTWQMAGTLQTAVLALLPRFASDTRQLLPPAIRRQWLRIKQVSTRVCEARYIFENV
jgi:hypothetical protein